MNALLLTAALLLVTTPPPDGSLLFLENSNLFVELYTGSGTTHVAIVLHDEDQPFVYEATPGAVRKIALADYYADLGRLNHSRTDERKIRVCLVQPRAAYTPAQIEAMRGFVEAQLGRRYSIKSHVRGVSDGIHCAELVASALSAAQILTIERCQDESPASLLERVKPLSRPLANVEIAEPDERPAWIARRHQDWTGFSGWCQWSCWETWTWCW